MMEELGSGFYLAMHDLEIRGAGEVLGESQSGEMQEVGFALYAEMLNAAVKSLKAGKEPELSANFNLGTKFVFSPLIGFRYFVTDAVALSLENRFNFWNIKYTASFAQESVSSSEWSVTPWVNIGLQIAWPF